jgi:predicted RNA-binding Zn ribbon-like protein
MIEQCEGDVCGWLFLDRSPAGRRRWCSMRDCGNRAKARRHYYTRRRA